MNKTLKQLSLRVDAMQHDLEVLPLKKALDAFLDYPSNSNGNNLSSFLNNDEDIKNFNLLNKINENKFNNNLDEQYSAYVNELIYEGRTYLSSFVYKGLSKSDIQLTKHLMFDFGNMLAIGLACVFLASPILPIIACLAIIQTLKYAVQADYSKVGFINGIKAIGKIALNVVLSPINFIIAPFRSAFLFYKFLTSSKEKDQKRTELDYNENYYNLSGNFYGHDLDDDSFDLYSSLDQTLEQRRADDNLSYFVEEDDSPASSDELNSVYRVNYNRRLPLHSINYQTPILEPVEPASASMGMHRRSNSNYLP